MFVGEFKQEKNTEKKSTRGNSHLHLGTFFKKLCSLETQKWHVCFIFF